MGKKIYLLFFLLAGLTVFSVFAPGRLLSKNTFVSTITVSRAEEEHLPATFSLPDKIKEGQEILKKSPLLGYIKKETLIYNKSKKVIGKKVEVTRQEIALAVLDTQIGFVFEKRYWLEAEDIKKGN